MPIPLGRTFASDPTLVLWQIVATTTLFFIVLGGTDYVLAVVSFFAFHAFSSDSHMASTSLAERLVAYLRLVPLRSIFTYTLLVDTNNAHNSGGSTAGAAGSLSNAPTVKGGAHVGEVLSTVGSDAHFLILHAITAVVAAFLVAKMIQRRKFVTDFTITIYVVYIIVAWIVLGSFPILNGFWWCLCVGSGGLTMWALMQWYCQKLELQDITLAPLHPTPLQIVATGPAASGVAATTPPSSAMHEEVSAVHYLRSPSMFSTSHHHHRSASGVGLLAATATTSSPQSLTTSSSTTVLGVGGGGSAANITVPFGRDASPAPLIEMTPNSIKRR